MKKISVAISSAIILLFLSPISALAVVPSSDVSYDSTVIAQITVNPELHRPQTLRLQGPVVIRSSEIGDMDGDGKPDIQTEIVSMNLTGTGPQGLAVNLNSSKSNRSMGMAEELRSNPFPFVKNRVANSFFDVFFEIGLSQANQANAASVYVTDEPIHIKGIARSLTNLEGTYISRKSVSIVFQNDTGNATILGPGPVGKLKILAVNLNSSKSN